MFDHRLPRHDIGAGGVAIGAGPGTNAEDRGMAAGIPSSASRSARWGRCASARSARESPAPPPGEPPRAACRRPRPGLIRAGRIASSPRTITLTSASRGRSQLSDPAPGDRVAVADHELDHLRAERADRPRLRQRPRQGGLCASSPQRPGPAARRSSPGAMVEMTTAKKTMLKYSRLLGTPLITGKVASTTGTAPRSPAQPRTSRSRALKRSKAVASAVASGRATKATTRAIRVPSTSTSPSWLGKTSKPRVRKSVIWATQARPSWKAVIVRLAGIVGAAERQPRQVHGQEAGAVDDRRAAVGEARGGDRGHRVEAGGLQVQAPEGPDRAHPHGHAPRPGRCRAARANSQAMSATP